MSKFLLGVLATVALPSAAGAVIGPPISFASGNTIYLVNPDGTGLSTVYQGPRGTAVQWVDLKPGGGEVAFVENHVLKILSYGDTGRPTSAPRTIVLPCAVALEVDHNPADGSLAVKDGCAPQHIWRVDSTGAHLMVTQPTTIGDVIWSSDGSHLYYDLADGIHSFDPATGGTALVLSPDRSMWSATQTGDRLVLGTTNGNYFIHDFATGVDAPGCTQGQVFHYGNGDSQMVFRIPAHNAFYVAVENTNCSGLRLITSRAGAYAGIDWAAP